MSTGGARPRLLPCQRLLEEREPPRRGEQSERDVEPLEGAWQLRRGRGAGSSRVAEEAREVVRGSARAACTSGT